MQRPRLGRTTLPFWRIAQGVALLGVLTVSSASFAEEGGADHDHAIELELGASGEHEVGGSSRVGLALSGEVTPIENWLEVEFGLSALGSSVKRELSSDLVFKKPFRISDSTEFMIGLGPFVSRTKLGSGSVTSHGLEAALDFMFWTHNDTGWYFEPTWSRTSKSRERAIGITVGILFGL